MFNQYDDEFQLSQRCRRCCKFLYGNEKIVDDPDKPNFLIHKKCLPSNYLNKKTRKKKSSIQP